MSVVVTGMHRSGTSAVARGVEALGLALGAGQRMPATEANARGFFERVDVGRFNDDVLAMFNAAWDAPPSPTTLDINRIAEPEVQSMRHVLDLFAVDFTNWYVKDPRLSFLLPLWDRLCLRRLPTIAVLREPSEVAASLKLRSGISERRSLALWLRYNQALAAASSERPILLLEYERTTADPSHALGAVHDFLHATGSVVRDIAEVDPTSLLEASLRRQANTALTPDVSYLLEAARAVHASWAPLHAQPTSEGLPTFDLPAGAQEALGELTELHQLRERLTATQLAWEERAATAGWTDTQIPGTPRDFTADLGGRLQEVVASFERDQMEEDLVHTLNRLQTVQLELAGIKASRTYKASRALAAPIRRSRK